MPRRANMHAVNLCRRIVRALERYPNGLPLGEVWEDPENTLWKETFGKKQELEFCLAFLIEIGVVAQIEFNYVLTTRLIIEGTERQVRQELRKDFWLHIEKFFQDK